MTNIGVAVSLHKIPGDNEKTRAFYKTTEVKGASIAARETE